MRRKGVHVLFMMGVLLINSPAVARMCSAEASLDSSDLSESRSYQIRFDVHSDDCAEHSCHGYVRVAITYSHGFPRVTSTDREEASYTIPRRGRNAEVSLERQVGLRHRTRIVHIEVEEVTCATP